MIRRRSLLAWIAGATAAGVARAQARRTLDIRSFGATGDGRTPATAAIQRAIDAAHAGDCVLIPRGRFVTGPLRLTRGIELRIGGTLLASTRPEDYPDPGSGLIEARSVTGLRITGSGQIDGRSPEFMERYDAENEWFVPKAFRPRLLILEDCAALDIRDLTIRNAPSWTIHLLGCRQVRIARVTIDNQLDVPNCDGIDPDHCQDVEIRDCRIRCGDDAIVIKTTSGHDQYGPSHTIRVRDCVLETQDSGLKIGTETTQDIYDVLFERCRIVSGCRGLCIQLRDEGNVRDITFRQIRFTARYFSAPWWGRGEGISFTAIPRTPATRLGTISRITVEDVVGRAENSVRIEGSPAARIQDIVLRRVRVTLGRWTRYPGGVFDNRPTSAVDPLEAHATPGIHIRHADRIALLDSGLDWAANPPDGFTHAVEAVDVTALDLTGFVGGAAHPSRDEAVLQR